MRVARARSRLLPVAVAALASAVAACVTTPETGRHAFIIVPTSVEQRLGARSFEEVLAKEHETTDAPKKALVERVGRRIAAVTNHPEWAWEFRTIESPQANAFCLPGGKVVVYTGLFPYLGDEAGLATVVGHEVAHAIARHGAQRMSQQLVIAAGIEVAALSLGSRVQHDRIVALLGAGATVGIVLPFSREQELEADEIGLSYMARAGYDPAEAIVFWKRFEAASAGKAPPALLSDHPSDADRIAQMEKLQPRARQEATKAREHLGAGARISG